MDLIRLAWYEVFQSPLLGNPVPVECHLYVLLGWAAD